MLKCNIKDSSITHHSEYVNKALLSKCFKNTVTLWKKSVPYGPVKSSIENAGKIWIKTFLTKLKFANDQEKGLDTNFPSNKLVRGTGTNCLVILKN